MAARSHALVRCRRDGWSLWCLGTGLAKTPENRVPQPRRSVAAHLARSGAESIPKIILDTERPVWSLALTALSWRHGFPSRCPYTENGTPLDVYIHESLSCMYTKGEESIELPFALRRLAVFCHV